MPRRPSVPVWPVIPKRKWTVVPAPGDVPADAVEILFPLGYAHDALQRVKDFNRQIRLARHERERMTHPKPLLDNQPTPETKARLRPSAVLRLHSTGAIGREEVQAADEIADVWQALTAAMFPAGGYGGARRPGFGPRAGPTVPPELWKAYLRYRQWSAEVEEIRFVPRFGDRSKNVLEVVIDVVCDGRSLRELEREIGMRNGGMTEVLANALKLYARKAGWLPEPKPADAAKKS